MSQHIAKVALPIRRPASEVFSSFVDPPKLARFWLQSASAPLSMGATVEWRFMVPDAVETVTVHELQLDQRIAFSWSDGVRVCMDFTEFGPDETLISLEASGFKNDDVEAVIGATEGFSIVLCDLKTLLESGRSANLVRDKAQLISRRSGPHAQDNA